ncbi:MAG: hypothetical protein IKG27_04500 [Bacilli bacterium]|nr:hypothetical protein [Bacilli bacterium]
MSSRMERYKNKTVKSSRSSRNRSLYNSIYSYDDKYSNIEGVASIDKENEIDISKVKRMLEDRENTSRRAVRDSSSENTDSYPILKDRYKEDTDRNYDIVDVLKTAKENKEPDNKERVLNNTNYDILKKLNLKSGNSVEDNKEEDLEDLIKTISNTSMLNKSKEETSTDMFSDLMSDDTKVGDVKDFTEFTSMNSKTMDDSFFTGGVRLKRADFVDGGEKKGSFLKTFFLVLFVLIIIAGAAFFALKYFHIIDF